MYCSNSTDLPQTEIPKTLNAFITVLSPDSDQDFTVRRIRLEAGGTMPNHTNKIQHQQYVLSGEAKVCVGEETHHAKQGDLLYIPAGVPHSYEACYDSAYVFLCIIPKREDSITFFDK